VNRLDYGIGPSTGPLGSMVGNDVDITIEVEGTRTEDEARKIAKTIADRALVKTAVFGADPNWGRIVPEPEFG